MTVKIGGKTYKGKYKGPDQFKGDQKKIDAHNAAKRKAANPAPKPAAKSTLASKATTKAAAPFPTGSATGTPAAPNLGAVGSNSTGSLQLQTNADIENEALEAHRQLAEENERAAQMEQGAIPQYELGKKNARDTFQEQRGQSNAQMAFRGMQGTAALNRSAQDKNTYANNMSNVETQKTAADTGALNIRTAAQNWFNTRQGQLENSRQAYTAEQGRTNPTAGTTPIESGLKATTPYSAPKPAAVKAAAKKTTVKAKPKFKGKYPGPDKYKGNKSLIAAAKRKAGRK